MNDIKETLHSFFLGRNEFHGFGLKKMKNTYHWNISDNIRSAIPSLPIGNDYEANVYLKMAMSQLWKEATSLREREQLTRFIVADWGGIRGNKESRYSQYAIEASKNAPEMGFKGIASFSKVLAIQDPETYAIYDARVAVALNAIHIIGNPLHGELYPYLPGRNNVTGSGVTKRGFSVMPVNATKQLSERHPNWVCIMPKTAYQSYLALLNSVIHMLPDANPIYDLEMCLFSQAEDLACLASPVLVQS